MSSSQFTAALVGNAYVEYPTDPEVPAYVVNRGFTSAPELLATGIVRLTPQENKLNPEEVTVTALPKGVRNGVTYILNAELIEAVDGSSTLVVYCYATGGPYAELTLVNIPFWVHILSIR